MIKTAIWVDPIGSMSETPEEQVERNIEYYRDELGVELDAYTPQNAAQIQDGTDLVLFDFGGMMMGNDLADHNSRYLLQWAEDHPSSLVVIISDFTYDHSVRHVIADHMGLETCAASYSKAQGERHKTPIHNVVVEHANEDFIPKWFRDAHKCRPADAVQPPEIEIAETDVEAAVAADLAKPSGLPAQKFFEPKKKFLSVMTYRFGGDHVFDVGCGMAHVAKALKDTGEFKNVFALDLMPREGGTEFPVYQTDARYFPFPSKAVVMFCRPCHGSFVEETVARALDCGAKAVVYAGLEKNFENDLGEYAAKFRLVAENVGDDGEKLWIYKPRVKAKKVTKKAKKRRYRHT